MPCISNRMQHSEINLRPGNSTTSQDFEAQRVTAPATASWEWDPTNSPELLGGKYLITNCMYYHLITSTCIFHTDFCEIFHFILIMSYKKTLRNHETLVQYQLEGITWKVCTLNVWDPLSSEDGAMRRSGSNKFKDQEVFHWYDRPLVAVHFCMYWYCNFVQDSKISKHVQAQA